MFSWFAFFRDPDLGARLPADQLSQVAAALRSITGVRQARIFTPPPDGTAHPFPDDAPSPILALQLHFVTLAELEAALSADGALARVAALPGLRNAMPSHQVMVVRIFPVPDARLRTPEGTLPCSYLVHYPGAPDDAHAWHSHYIDNHPPLMARFPGVREIELYTRCEWVARLPWRREDAFQRNKLMFDSAAALSAGLLSPAIRDMRADFHQFPAFSGGNVHYPMLTHMVAP